MKRQFWFIAAVLLPLAAGPAAASPFILYLNDFNTRTSVGPIGGTTTFDYAVGNLVGSADSTSGTQDGWIRRNSGAAPITVEDYAPAVNQHGEVGAITANFGYALQPIGSQVTEGVLRLSADILSPSGWNWSSSRNARFYLGDDDFYAGLRESAGNMVFYNQVAGNFGFSGTSNSDVRFVGTDGNRAGDAVNVFGTTPVVKESWYRFVADFDLTNNKYSVNVYHLGAEHPTPSTPTTGPPVQTFGGLDFRRELGSAAVDLNGLTTVGVASFGNSSDVKFDNLVIAGHTTPHHGNPLVNRTLNTNPTVYWRLDEPVGTTARDSRGSFDGVYYDRQYPANPPAGMLTLGTPGPRPSDGVYAMSEANLAPDATGQAGRVEYTSLTTTAGIPTGSYSYQMWFNSSASSWNDHSLQYLFTRGNDTTDVGRRDAVYIGGSANAVADRGKLALLAGGVGTAWGARVLDANRWYHLTFVRNDYEDPENSGAMIGDVKVYLNGNLEVQSTFPWQGGAGNYFTAGTRTDRHPSLGLEGRFDEVVLWDRPLGEAEAKNLYLGALGSPYLASVLRKEPEAYWRLEETTGTNTAYDSTGNRHSFTYGTVLGRTGEGSDVGPQSPQFGGLPADNRAPTLPGLPLDTTAYLGTVNGLLPGDPGGTNNDYSVEMWVRRGDDPNAHGDYIMHRWDTDSSSNRGDFLGVSNYVGDEYSLFVWAGDSTVPNRTGTTMLKKNEWHHVAMVRQGDAVQVYLDGLPEISVTMPSLTGLNWDAGTWTFGGRRDMGQQKFAGNLDEIAVYAGALSGDNFQENYLSAIVQRDVPYAKTVLRYGPESYWRLDEVSPYTLAVDATGYGHTFTYHAAASRTGSGEDVGPRGEQYPGLGPDNNAPRLTGGPLGPGDNGYLGIASEVLASRNDYSAQFWFRPGIDGNDHGDYLLHRGDGDSQKGDYLGIASPGTGGEYTNLFFYGGDNIAGVDGRTQLVTGEWHHVAMVRQGDNVMVYLNGQPEIMVTRAATDDFSTGQWAFGGRSDLPWQQKFTGNLDEISLYGRPLSTFHVQASYLSALPRDQSDYSDAILADNPAAYWRLNEGSEWVAAMDSTGNAQHFEYHPSLQRGAGELGPSPSVHHLGFERGNTAPQLTAGYLGIASGVLPGQNDYTVEMWFRGEELGTTAIHLMQRNDWDATADAGDFLGIAPDEGDGARLFVHDGSDVAQPLYQGTTSILEDEWYHIAMVRDDDDVMVYLNGRLEIEGTMSLLAGTKWVDGTWVLGGSMSDYTYLHEDFTRSIDEIAIYGRPLSHAEIRDHYLVGVPEPTTWLLLAFGALSLMSRRCRKRRYLDVEI